MKRIVSLAALAAFVLGLALSHPAVAKNDKEKPEKEKTNNRVEKILVCHVTQTEAIGETWELASGHIVAIPASAVEAHERAGDLAVYDEAGEEQVAYEPAEDGAEAAAGDACSFEREAEVKEKNPNHARGRNKGDEG